MYTHETIDTVRLYPAWVSWLAAIAAFLSSLASIFAIANGTLPVLFGIMVVLSIFYLPNHLVRQTRIRFLTSEGD